MRANAAMMNFSPVNNTSLSHLSVTSRERRPGQVSQPANLTYSDRERMKF